MRAEDNQKLASNVLPCARLHPVGGKGSRHRCLAQLWDGQSGGRGTNWEVQVEKAATAMEQIQSFSPCSLLLPGTTSLHLPAPASDREENNFPKDIAKSFLKQCSRLFPFQTLEILKQMQETLSTVVRNNIELWEDSFQGCN